MDKNRLEAFSDGVLAIIITIMVLELKQPVGDNWNDLFALGPVLSQLCAQLFVRRYLLGESSLDLSTGGSDQCQDPVVQYRMAFCNVVHPVRHRMDRELSDF